MTFEPKSIGGIKAELREQQETLGIPVPVLKSMGKELSKFARKNVDDYIPLARLLWDEYGREGRVVAAIALGAMELVEPARIVILLKELCRTCITWEDSDRLAMDVLEPIVRKEPDDWLGAIEPWLGSENKWVRRAGVTVLARLPMKQPYFTERCLELIEPLLNDEEVDVRKAVSFAIRLSVRGKLGPVKDFLQRNVPPENPNSTWILCDAIRKWASPFVWIGTNAIAIYTLSGILGGLFIYFMISPTRGLLGVYADLLVSLVYAGVTVLIAYGLFQRKIFIRL